MIRRTITIATSNVPDCGLPYPLPEEYSIWTYHEIMTWLKEDVKVPDDKMLQVIQSCVMEQVSLH
jgi:hypothetical protein